MFAVGTALLSASFITAKDVISKKLSGRVDGTVSTFASFMYPLPLYVVLLAVLWWTGAENFAVSGSFLLFILGRSLSDTCAEWCKMQAFAHGDLSVVTSFFSLYPIILLLVSPLLTGDPLTTDAIIGTVVIVCGTLVILYRPRGSQERLPLKGILLALTAAVFFSINTSLDRMAVQTSSPTLAAFSMTFLAAVFLLPGLWMKRSIAGEQLVSEFKLFSLRGIFEVTFMVTKLYALAALSAPIVVALQRISILFSIISGRIVFQEGQFLQRLIGGGLVTGGIAWTVYTAH